MHRRYIFWGIILISYAVCLGLLLCLYVQPQAMVLPHHNVVQAERLEFLQKIKKMRFVTHTVILLSPDHFSSNQRSITYADRTWNLSNGEIHFARDYEPIVSSYLLENETVKQDHGITNILPDIKTVWPHAEVVPIVIGQEMPLEQVRPLVDGISRYCLSDCLLVTSVDFSHYLPYALADVHDAHTIQRLQELTIASPKDIEVDSPQALYVLTEFAKRRNAFRWNLHLHTSSTQRENNRDAESTSHVMGWYSRLSQTSPQLKKTNTTFIVARDVNEKRDTKLLGTRFFYGTDRSDFDLHNKKCFGETVCFSPAGDATAIDIITPEGNTEVTIPSTFVIAGEIISSRNFSLVFLPTKLENGSKTLLRGKEKTDALSELFSQFPQKDGYTYDLWNGTIEVVTLR